MNHHIMTWDWKEQPDLTELAGRLLQLSEGRIHLYEVETGSDQYAIVLSDAAMDAAAVKAAFDDRWGL